MTAGQARELAAMATARECQAERRQAWVLSIATDLEDRIRLLARERRAAYLQVKAIRDGGHLIPSSLREEITDNEAALLLALSRYRELAG